MKGFSIGMAAGLAVSAAITAALMPKKTTMRRKMGKTLKSMVDFVDDLSDAIRG